MKKINEEDIKIVENELSIARKEFDEITFNSLDEKLEWIKNFFNVYVSKLEEKFMTDEERNEFVFLPNELRIKFYLYFPEHGLNMANYSQELAQELSKHVNNEKQLKRVYKSYFRHDD